LLPKRPFTRLYHNCRKKTVSEEQKRTPLQVFSLIDCVSGSITVPVSRSSLRCISLGLSAVAKTIRYPASCLVTAPHSLRLLAEIRIDAKQIKQWSALCLFNTGSFLLLECWLILVAGPRLVEGWTSNCEGLLDPVEAFWQWR